MTVPDATDGLELGAFPVSLSVKDPGVSGEFYETRPTHASEATRMNEDLWTAVDGMMEELFVGRDEALSDALAASEEAGLPEIAVSPLYGKLLSLLTASTGARRVLEVGTLGGYSTICMARALPADGILVTVESNPDHARVARANIDRAGVGDQVRIEIGGAKETLARLAESGEDPFDLVFLDADKEGLADYLDGAVTLSRPGTLIVSDNVVRDGAVMDAATEDPMVQGVRRFLERAAGNPRLETTVIQTVGNKGYDGLALTRVADAT